MGHYSVALTLKEQIEEMNPTANVSVVDFIQYMIPKVNDIAYGAYNVMVDKFPNIYNLLNNISSKNSKVPLSKKIFEKLSVLLNDCDVVISTLPICSQYVSAYKKTKKSSIYLYTYVTDILIHGEWISENVNMYFVGDRMTKDILISKGVSPQIIKVTGIPVKKEFKYEKKNPKMKKVLVMGGGLGIIPQIEEFLNYMNTHKEIAITVITGKNVKLMKKIQTKFPDINVVGYTNNVSKYMNEADLVITKAGGITTFEAIHSMVPLCIIKPFLCQEVGNANFIDMKNIGQVFWNNKKWASNVIEILNDDEKLKNMKINMKKVNDNFEKYSIFDAILEKKTNKC